MTHTPLPWKKGVITNTSIEGPSGRHVTSTGGYSDNSQDDGGLAENEANAEFIIKAANSHYHLVQTLEVLEEENTRLREALEVVVKDYTVGNRMGPAVLNAQVALKGEEK